MLITKIQVFLTAALLTVALGLAGCGGGGGAAGSAGSAGSAGPVAPVALDVAPKSATVYVGTETVFTISGGTKPYKVFSSDQGVISFVSNDIVGDTFTVTAKGESSTGVTLTVKDVVNNSFNVDVKAVIPVALGVAPASATVYLNTPAAFTISGGIKPYKVFSSDQKIITFDSQVLGNDVVGSTFIVIASNVVADTPVTLTVTDAVNKSFNFIVTAKTGVGPVTALAVYPGVATVYYGVPTEFTILGGVKDYSVFSGHPAIKLPSAVSGNSFIVTADNVVVDTPVTLTVADKVNTTAQSTVTVKPASLFNSSLKVTPDSSSSTCSPAICSGGTGLVGVQLQFGSIAGHNVKLEVLQGDYVFVSGATTSSSLTVITDTLGASFATIRANTNAPTQYAILKATDLSNGSSQQTTFVIAQNTSGASILSVVPDKNTLSNTNLSLGTCNSGAIFNYYVFGGTPPYRIVSTNDLVATVLPGSVSSNGGGFTATTKGIICGDVTFAITDATGRTTTATLTNTPSTLVATTPTPVTPATLVVAPATATMLVASKPQTLTFNFAGGTAPYTVSTSNPLFVTTAYASGLTFTASSVAVSAAVATNTVTLTVLDSAGKVATSVVTFQ